MNNEYTSPFSERYAGAEMKYLFSPDKKFSTWRRLWIALAEAGSADFAKAGRSAEGTH